MTHTERMAFIQTKMDAVNNLATELQHREDSLLAKPEVQSAYQSVMFKIGSM